MIKLLSPCRVMAACNADPEKATAVSECLINGRDIKE
jgi:hypothetical protein